MMALITKRTFARLASRNAVVFRYWKPIGVVSAMSKTVDGIDILSDNPSLAETLAKATGGRAVQTIGRLDKDSEGLLLLTSDMPLINRLLHPGKGVGSPVEKVYHVRTNRRVPPRILERLRTSVSISTEDSRNAKARAGGGDDEDSSYCEKLVPGKVGPSGHHTLPCVVDRLVLGDQRARLRIVLREGKNRQIRKMLGGQGYRVVALTRVGFGPVALEGLSPGQAKQLTSDEVAALLKAADATRAQRIENGSEMVR